MQILSHLDLSEKTALVERKRAGLKLWRCSSERKQTERRIRRRERSDRRNAPSVSEGSPNEVSREAVARGRAVSSFGLFSRMPLGICVPKIPASAKKSEKKIFAPIPNPESPIDPLAPAAAVLLYYLHQPRRMDFGSLFRRALF